jgi:hypothetical protein
LPIDYDRARHDITLAVRRLYIMPSVSGSFHPIFSSLSSIHRPSTVLVRLATMKAALLLPLLLIAGAVFVEGYAT